MAEGIESTSDIRRVAGMCQGAAEGIAVEDGPTHVWAYLACRRGATQGAGRGYPKVWRLGIGARYDSHVVALVTRFQAAGDGCLQASSSKLGRQS